MLNKVVTCIKDVHFCDGTYHKRGKKYVVEKENLTYYELFLNIARCLAPAKAKEYTLYTNSNTHS